MRDPFRNALLLPLVLLVGLLAGPSAAAPLRVVTTTSNLGDLVATVGGDEVDVTVLARGPQDAHFVEPRPSFIRALHRADLFVQVGLQLEIGWAPALQRSARNPDVVLGGDGFVDASTVIAPREIPLAATNRSMGDVHPFGNPHYLSDPLNGLRVARLLRDRLTDLRPGSAAGFASRYDAFASRVVTALVGADYAAGRSPEEVAGEIERGTAELSRVGGWLGRAQAKSGLVAVQDHRLWPYFAQRFGLHVTETLEPKPGIAPTTRHLARVIDRMGAEGASLILASPYFDPRHAAFVSERTGARVALMAHQVDAREGTGDYLAMVDHNVRAVFEGP
jgi:ABC-type Zn uptake system ZnuABC Zn-binding protein ZnuA